MLRIPSILLSAAMLTLCAAPLAAQTVVHSVRVTRMTVVLDAPRGDSVPLGSVAAGDRVSVFEQQGTWLLISRDADSGGKGTWRRGWVHASSIDPADLGAVQQQRRQAPGHMMWRGIGQGAGMRFTAADSFSTILDSAFGPLFGGGGQVVWPNGAFAQVTFERYQSEGSRALVSGTQIFTTTTPTRVTVMPLLISGGLRYPGSHRYVPYVGGGLGWHTLEEESPEATSPEIRTTQLGYHVFGGIELPVLSWLSMAGEAQWSTVPDGLGGTGLPAVFAEDDLGGIALRFKVIVGK
jgi:opacity protein-like surface antigen